MAELPFNIGMAVAIQSGIGQPNIPAAWGTTTIGEADGAVLGDREQGDGESGITIPNLQRRLREAARAGRTATFDSFLGLDVDGLAFGYARKGNGAASTPSSGEAIPPPGIDALNRMAGLVGAASVDPIYFYQPATTQEYATIGLWIGDPTQAQGLRYYYQDCVVSTRRESPEGGEVWLIEDTIGVGSLNAAAENIQFPDFQYGNQSTLAAPVVELVGNTFGILRSPTDIEITIDNGAQRFGDLNAEGGTRVGSGNLDITARVTFRVDDAEELADYNRLIATTEPTESWNFQVGPTTTPTNPLNAIASQFVTPRVEEGKENKSDVTVRELLLRARSASAGGEYTLTYL